MTCLLSPGLIDYNVHCFRKAIQDVFDMRNKTSGSASTSGAANAVKTSGGANDLETSGNAATFLSNGTSADGLALAGGVSTASKLPPAAPPPPSNKLQGKPS